jgi:hypothetical protein
MVSCFRMGCNVRLTVLGHISVHDCPRSTYHRMSTANGFGIRSNVEGREISRKDGERGPDDEVVMAATCLQPKLASRARLEDVLNKLPAQKLAAGRFLRDSQNAAPHDGAEPLDQPRLANDQAVSLSRAGKRSIAADQTDAHVRWCFRQQFCRGVAETALIEDEEVEPSEVRCDQGELLAQRSLRQAQRRTYDEPVRLGVQEHERAKVAPTGKIEAGDMTGEHRRNVRDAAARQCGVRS